MKRILILIFLSLTFTVSGEENRYAFSGLSLENDTISPAPIIFLFNNGAKINAQLFGVGWYEYSLITDKTVEFVAEERGKIFDRRKSTASTSDICDMYGLIFNSSGIEIDVPDYVKFLCDDKLKMKYDNALEFQKQDFPKLLKNLKQSKYYKIDISEPGFIQMERAKEWFQNP